MRKNVFVSVSSGNIGRHLTASLVALGLHVKAGSRTGAPVIAGAEGVKFDFTDPSTFAAALEDVSAVFVMNPGGTQDEGKFTKAFLELAVADKTRKIVFLSGIGAEDGKNSKRDSELFLQASGNPFVVLRPTWFMDNFANFYGTPIKAGNLRLAAGDGKISFIDSRDIADVAAVTMVTDKYHGQFLELTGPEAFNTEEVIAMINRATGLKADYTPVSSREFIADMVSAGMSEHYAGMIAESFEAVVQGKLAPVLPTVPNVTGQPARTLSAWVTENAARF
jgi:uncharacterized protein YbjT (DUF2867 family)